MSAATKDTTGRVVPILPKVDGVTKARPAHPQLDLERYPALARDAVLGLDAMVARTSKPVREVWFGLVAGDNLVEISGPSGEGKTTLAVMLASALASNGPVVPLFERHVMPAARGRFVVFIEEENSARGIHHKIRDACELLELDLRDVMSRLVILPRKGVRLGDQRWTEITALARDGLLGALFIDSRARVLRRDGHDADDEANQAEVSGELFGIIELARAPVFVISHFVKGRGRKGGDLEDIAGSGQRGAAADVVLLVTATKNECGAVVSSTLKVGKVRDDIDEHPKPVTYSICRTDDGTKVLRELGAEPTPSRPQSSRSQGPDRVDRVRGVLGDVPLTVSQIRARLPSMSSSAIGTALDALRDRGEVREVSTIGGNGRPTLAFALASGGVP